MFKVIFQREEQIHQWIYDSLYGTNGSKQQIKNKPIWVGHNIWFLAEACGYVVQFNV